MKKPFSSLFKPAHLAILVFALPAGNLPADSLWKTGISQPMYADKKAHAVGDILTVVIQENNASTRNNQTTTAKTSSIDASIASFLYGPAASGLLTKGGQYPAMSLKGASAYNGGGTINNSETITAQLAVRVIDVLPNGNMVIEGRRQTSYSGEKQDAILRGTIRPDDITPSDTIFSFNIADATIQFVGKGTISDAQRKNWFLRLWDKFSPF
jgi:flagellar L-ring protein precursor FlgH